MSILYIDDDVEDSEIFQEAVKAVDPAIRYVNVSSAKEALALLKGAHPLPQHIVMDINMPVMDGKTCLREIRNDKRFDAINIVIYSTNSFPKDVELIESLGATFMRKANSFTDLCTMIRQMISQNPR